MNRQNAYLSIERHFAPVTPKSAHNIYLTPRWLRFHWHLAILCADPSSILTLFHFVRNFFTIITWAGIGMELSFLGDIALAIELGRCLCLRRNWRGNNRRLLATLSSKNWGLLGDRRWCLFPFGQHYLLLFVGHYLGHAICIFFDPILNSFLFLCLLLDLVWLIFWRLIALTLYLHLSFRNPITKSLLAKIDLQLAQRLSFVVKVYTYFLLVGEFWLNPFDDLMNCS